MCPCVCAHSHRHSQGWTENAGPENGGPENGGPEIAGPSTCAENAGIMLVINDRNAVKSKTSHVGDSALIVIIEKVKERIAAVNGFPSHSYGTSLAIWDHTVLPATRHK